MGGRESSAAEAWLQLARASVQPHAVPMQMCCLAHSISQSKSMPRKLLPMPGPGCAAEMACAAMHSIASAEPLTDNIDMVCYHVRNGQFAVGMAGLWRGMDGSRCGTSSSMARLLLLCLLGHTAYLCTACTAALTHCCQGVCGRLSPGPGGQPTSDFLPWRLPSGEGAPHSHRTGDLAHCTPGIGMLTQQVRVREIKLKSPKAKMVQCICWEHLVHRCYEREGS